MSQATVRSCAHCNGRLDHAELDWRMPLTFDERQLDMLGSRICDLLAADGRPAHLVVVATSGFGMGLAALKVAGPGRVLSATIVKREFAFDAPDLAVGPRERVVLLDNSLHTGATAALVIDAMRRQRIQVDTLITLIGSKDPCEDLSREQLTTTAGITVLSCAEWSDRHLWLAPR